MTAELIYRKLVKLARERGRPGDELLTLYALERVLSRLMQTRFATDFSVKGGVLLAAYRLRRPTRDIDMQALDFPVDRAHLVEVVAAIREVKAPDGLVFGRSAVQIDEIREGDEYSGLRIHLPARLYRARLMIKLDVGTGDPIWPEPESIVLPGILGNDVQLRGAPLATVVAEKVVTILQRGAASTRWRDYLDIRNIALVHTFAAGHLWEALATVADYREVSLVPVLSVLGGASGDAERKWSAWRRRGQLEGSCLPRLADQIIEIADFIDPVLGGTVPRNARWAPARSAWEFTGERNP